jgi:hypothetical protein
VCSSAYSSANCSGCSLLYVKRSSSDGNTSSPEEPPAWAPGCSRKAVTHRQLLLRCSVSLMLTLHCMQLLAASQCAGWRALQPSIVLVPRRRTLRCDDVAVVRAIEGELEGEASAGAKTFFDVRDELASVVVQVIDRGVSA